MSGRFCWMLIAVVVTFAGLNVTQAQQVQVKLVHEGKPAHLECRGDHGSTCVWTAIWADGKTGMVAISDKPNLTRNRFTLVDKPEEGECSLEISRVEIEDSGNLTCAIDMKNVIQWTITVQTPPKDPRIEYNSESLNAGEVKELQSFPAELRCIVEGGNPEPIMSWQGVDYYKTNLSKDGVKTINTLTIDESSLPIPPQVVATCVAEQELYEGGQKIVSVTVGKAYETTEVIARYVQDGSVITATCTANGIPPPRLQWRYKENINDERGKDLASGANATFKDGGYYFCVAINEATGKELKQSDYIHNDNGNIHTEANESANSQQAGMIVGIVIAALVVIAIIGGLTLFTFRRRTLCFKERRPVPTNNPSNVENGGKIQTINSPDSKEKSEMKGDQNDNTKQKEIVYAQLDLPLSQGHNVNTPKSEEKTEYAQIKFQPKENQV